MRELSHWELPFHELSISGLPWDGKQLLLNHNRRYHRIRQRYQLIPFVWESVELLDGQAVGSTGAPSIVGRRIG